MFCRYCGKPTDSPVCPECAAVAQAAQAPAAPEAAQPPVTPFVTAEGYPAESYAYAEGYAYADPNAPVAEPVMDLGVEQPQPEKKKKSKKALWISLVAVLGVIGILVALFWGPLSLWLKYLTSPADEMLQEAETAALASYTETLSEYYGLLLKSPVADQQNTDATLQVEMNDMVADALSELLKTEGVTLSSDQLKNINLDVKAASTETLKQFTLTLKDMVEIQSVIDMQNSMLYLCIPQLNTTPIQLNLNNLGLNTAMFDPATLLVQQNPNDLTALVAAALTDKNVKAALPTKEEFKAMLDRVVAAALPALTEVEKEQATVTVGGHEQKQILLTTNINAVTARKMVGEVLKVAQNDATLKTIVTVINDYIYNQTGKNYDLYNELSNEMKALQGNLNKEIDFAGTVQLTTYVNGDLEVLGRRVTTIGFGEGNNSTVYYNAVEDGDATYFEYKVPDSPVITGSTETADNATTTKLHLPLEGEMAVDLTLKSTENGGSLRVTPNQQASETLLNELGIPTTVVALGNPSIEVSYQMQGLTKADVSLRLLMGETSLLSVSTKSTTSTDNVQVTVPQNAVDVMNDQLNAYYWAYEAANNLPTLLRKFGLSEQIIEELLTEIGNSLI